VDWYMDPALMEPDEDLMIIENRASLDSPCLALSFAILNEALYDLTKEGAVRQEARQWFHTDDYVHPFSFVNIANNFNLDVQAIRLRIDSTEKNISFRKRSGNNQWTLRSEHEEPRDNQSGDGLVNDAA
jgi:hypothetical protein